jgi:putative ABC transport system permease protein
LARIESEIRALLPAAYSFDKPGVRSQENQRMLRAFRWNLRVLSYISLIVGAFLIYNTISVSVVRRRPEIGVLRALGTGRAGILWLFLGEALLLGIAGSALGTLLGRLLAEGAVGLIADTVNSLYTSSRPAEVAMTWSAVVTGMVAGTAVALASAFAPAREAMAVTPVSAMGRGAHERQSQLRWGRDLIVSTLLAAAALIASLAPAVDGQPLWGYAAALMAISLGGVRGAGIRAPGDYTRAWRLASSLRRRGTAGWTRPGCFVIANLGDRRRASDRGRHDGERRASWSEAFAKPSSCGWTVNCAPIFTSARRDDLAPASFPHSRRRRRSWSPPSTAWNR